MSTPYWKEGLSATDLATIAMFVAMNYALIIIHSLAEGIIGTWPAQVIGYLILTFGYMCCARIVGKRWSLALVVLIYALLRTGFVIGFLWYPEQVLGYLLIEGIFQATGRYADNFALSAVGMGIGATIVTVFYFGQLIYMFGYFYEMWYMSIFLFLSFLGGLIGGGIGYGVGSTVRKAVRV